MADSNIEQLLKQILDTKLGKDMRQAIHDGIEQCYEDGKVGSVDLVARQRIDNLAKLQEGSTTGDAELMDIRIGYDGTKYETAGEAVRGQISPLSENITINYTQLYDIEKVNWNGFYQDGNLIDFSYNKFPYGNIFIDCKKGDTIYINYIARGLSICFFNDDEFIAQRYISYDGINLKVKVDVDCNKCSVPVYVFHKYNLVISKEPCVLFDNVSNNVTAKNIITTNNEFKRIANRLSFEKKYPIYMEDRRFGIQCSLLSSFEGKPEFTTVIFNTLRASFLATAGYILLGVNENNEYLALSLSGELYILKKLVLVDHKLLYNYNFSIRNKKIIIEIDDTKVTIRDGLNLETIFQSDLHDFYYNKYRKSIGFVYITNPAYNNVKFMIYYDVDFQYPYYEENHWRNKKWFSYGTSLTSTAQGKYADELSKISGLNLTNKGIPGGALVANRNIYNALLDNNDGKIDADLITIEVGANDGDTPLGDISSLDDTTLSGALNICLKSVLTNCPKAQVVLMPSTRSRYEPNSPSQKYSLDSERPGGGTYEERDETIRKIAVANGVYYIPFGSGLGLGLFRQQSSDLYNVDQIHHTELGGYNLAKGIWGYLKNIPLWYSEIPE